MDSFDSFLNEKSIILNNINNEEIFNLLKIHNFDEIYKLIKSKKIINLDFRDSNYNYFIQYIINYNQYNILKLILQMTKIDAINIRIDILDTDGRSILYNCIKTLSIFDFMIRSHQK